MTDITPTARPAGNGSPRFSVVVPALNEERYLPATLSSLLGQDYGDDFEVIVVDNNSTDATAAVARWLGATVVCEPVSGVCAARQRGSVLARGAVIVSADADTIYPQGWLRRIDAQFAAHPGAVAVAGPCGYTSARSWIERYPRVLFGLVDLVARRTGYVGYVSATNLAMTREAFPGYDAQQTQGGDELDLLRRLRRRGTVVWDRENVVSTSARRLERGFVYSLFVSFVADYAVAYNVNRWTRHRWMPTARAYRHNATVNNEG